MAYLEIAGGRPLYGEITVQGSKNAALPILAACILGEGPCEIENCPQIQDVEDTLSILRMLGCRAERSGHTVFVDAARLERYSIYGAEAIRIRSSILFLGALLGRIGKAVLPYPGGCAIGSRPIDLHLKALETLGAQFSAQQDTCFSDSRAETNEREAPFTGQCRICARAPELHGGSIFFAMPSVGATENAILAAVCADGTTVIENAAMEPEIAELCDFLKLRGATISWEEERTIRVTGTKRLSPVRYRLHADRIVAGNYLLAAATCGGCVRMRNLPFGLLDAPLAILRAMGMTIEEDGTVRAGLPLTAVEEVTTAPYPGFPTDLQSPMMAALCVARGNSRIRETVFENRFLTARQLQKMGARIETEKNLARIEGLWGNGQLCGTSVTAPDLRGGAALVQAASAAAGRTRIYGYEYIARGYEDICRDYRNMGAEIYLRE
ncbi:MAG: UDP-N-acetylglucosamine 1-carboxyvinyltransferase [Lachnospiraceae bacterium]|nr:UDP-N-acetylglucosamine 1-carboxyvinyltransferase [Lachnospiraceae bacterium]MCD7767119.1 UDP-N-acetylglucosamine 1-carboxyvinyltransferase [Lachnospiraceae bacterium]